MHQDETKVLTHSSKTNSWSHSLTVTPPQSSSLTSVSKGENRLWACVGKGVSEGEEQCVPRRWHCKGAVVTGDLTDLGPKAGKAGRARLCSDV